MSIATEFDHVLNTRQSSARVLRGFWRGALAVEMDCNVPLDKLVDSADVRTDVQYEGYFCFAMRLNSAK